MTKLKNSKFFSLFAGKHYKMERFSAMFMVLVLMLGLCVGLGFRDQNNAKKIILGEAAKYTSTTQFSLTGDEFSVIDVYRNTNFTKAFILLKTTSMSKLPLDASKYEIFMTSGDKSKPLTGHPVGGIYIFGTTGYIGLSFMDEAGFASNLYDIVLRNWDMVAAGDVERAKQNYASMGASFWNYNQLPITANLAGTKATIVPFLDADSFTLSDVYMQLVGEQSVKNLRANTSRTLLSMSSAMLAVNNAAEKLEARNIVVPALPHQIANDRITTNPELTLNNPTEFDAGMMSYIDSGSLYAIDSNVPTLSEADISAMIEAEENGADVDIEEENYLNFTANDTLYLQTDYVFPSGVQFNYQNVDLSSDLLDSIKDPSIRYSSWRSLKAAEVNRYADEMKMPKYTWKYTTGNSVPSLDAYSTQADKDAWAIIDEYTSAVNRLFTLKRQYQTDLLYGYLTISNEGRGIADIFSVNASENALWLY